MRDYLSDLRRLAFAEFKDQKDLDELSYSGLSALMQEERRADLEEMLKKDRARIERTAQELLRYPPHHNRHYSKLDAFWQSGGFEDSVFIMTKFPEGDSPADLQLQAVLGAISASLKALGLKPRLASDYEHHPSLWDNVELYLLGCARGIAVVEDRYKPELNPNVAMEWGWMRGMNRKVHFLVEKNFKHLRADVGGLLRKEFDWDDPVPTVSAALTAWFKPPP